MCWTHDVKYRGVPNGYTQKKVDLPNEGGGGWGGGRGELILQMNAG